LLQISVNLVADIKPEATQTFRDLDYRAKPSGVIIKPQLDKLLESVSFDQIWARQRTGRELMLTLLELLSSQVAWVLLSKN